jgi:hypothetical protein
LRGGIITYPVSASAAAWRGFMAATTSLAPRVIQKGDVDRRKSRCCLQARSPSRTVEPQPEFCRRSRTQARVRDIRPPGLALTKSPSGVIKVQYRYALARSIPAPDRQVGAQTVRRRRLAFRDKARVIQTPCERRFPLNVDQVCPICCQSFEGKDNCSALVEGIQCRRINENEDREQLQAKYGGENIRLVHSRCFGKFCARVAAGDCPPTA